ncbi:hypothetical protein HP397_06540 [Streptobacillus felis]|uniref:Uncharacterized protein n=1 Tax=Streptobacillus felis TaxID=1384509 RepID=A0A7Z0PHS2_9FUSO|nr:hypothetical protein [Streptobacillus felis]NYV28455.1 hypothetical protein [Streptobacillus felis]
MKENFLIALGIFFILLILSIFPIYRWLYGVPNEIRQQVVSYYEQEYNLIIQTKDISVGPYMLEHEGANANWSNGIYFEGNSDLKSKYFNNVYVENIKYDEQSIKRYKYYILDTHLQYMKPYIVNELIYDKSKGNDFEKILEILEENKLEICEAFSNDNPKKCNIKFDIHLIKKEFSGVRFVKHNNVIFGLFDKKIKYDDLVEQDILKEINSKPIKIENMDWDKYLEKSKMYILFKIYVEQYDDEYKWYRDYEAYINRDTTSEENDKLKYLFDKIKPYHNNKILDIVFSIEHFQADEEIGEIYKEKFNILTEKGEPLK